MSFASLKQRVRLELGDLGETFQAQVTGDGNQKTFGLPVRVVSGAGLLLVTSTGPLSEGPDYTVNEREAEIVFAVAPASGAVINVTGTSYRFFPDGDMDTFIVTAFKEHTVGRSPAPTYDTLPFVEEYLVAILASVEALWVMATDAAFDIDISVPEGVTIPRSQRFAQIMALIQQRMEQYKELAQALNVGPFRIQMFTLRRVSRTTNRLVPIYVPKEFDDRSYPPTRVFPPIDTGVTG